MREEESRGWSQKVELHVPLSRHARALSFVRSTRITKLKIADVFFLVFETCSPGLTKNVIRLVL